MKRKLKTKPLISHGKISRAEIVLNDGKKRVFLLRLQKQNKLEQVKGEIVNFEANKNKIKFYETDSEDLQFVQLSCYAQKPYQFMIVSGNRFIIMPFNIAFGLAKGLNQYCDYIKSMTKEGYEIDD